MAENKTINIKINSNTKEATKDTKDYNQAIGSTKKQYDAVLKSGDSYEKQLSDINKIVKETPLNVRDMNKQIQAYQSIALSAGRETPVGKEALKKAADLRDRYIDIQNETKRLADDQKNLQGALQLVGTGVAAFGGVQSAMALTGVESEKLRETMVKLQAAQTLMTSINQIATAAEKESSAMLLLKSIRTKVLASSTYAYATAQGVATTGAKLLRVAMVSTGVGALVVGIGLLIANFDKVKAVLTDVNKGFKEGGLMTKALMIAFMPLIATVKLFQKGLQAIGVLETEQEKTRKANAEEQAKRFEEEGKRHKTAMDNATKEIEAINKAIGKERERQKALEDTYNLELRKAEGNAEKIEEINKNLAQSKEDSIAEEQRLFLESKQAQIEQEEAGIAVFQAIIDANLARGRTDHARELSEVAKRTAKVTKLKAKALANDYDEIQAFNVRRENLDLDYEDGVDERRKARNEKYKQYAAERLNAARKIEDLENSLLEDGVEKELEINRDKFRRLQEDTKKNTKLTAKERKELNDLYTEQQEQSELKIKEKYDKIDSDREKKRLAEIEKQNNDFLKTIEDIAEQNYQNTLTDEERELTAVQDKYFALEEAAQGNAEALNEIEIARLNELNEIYVKYDDERDAAQKVRDDKAKADAKALEDYKISVVQGGLSAINDIAALFAKGNEKQQKRAFQVQKAVGIAQATINTAQAITKVFAETTDFTPTQSLRIANAVGIGIAGAAQIASIASQQFEGGGDVESPDDLGGGGGEAVAPSFNVVGDSGINQIAQLQQTPVQAFVVSGEVTTSQALDRNRVQNATL